MIFSGPKNSRSELERAEIAPSTIPDRIVVRSFVDLMHESNKVCNMSDPMEALAASFSRKLKI